ncbi:thiopeptide-type bacteriocin biosynthesis protein [Belliella pelovolcani]|uniref:Thiopeptide-type bacteriocin biosynthesis domain-containing protein n=1 Tax=Belliella pelovolcani TaxID=529505 RepID=A0A1N7Q3Y8_9BACT|nr:thiopeptide-type bacteriocin biosynthesis protein [Belliella pelovolcani]SIT17563.1 thiopeptide-type bacteriocin biosynthesis domain-containing protein [Belliella pelovolcani]
MDFIIRLPLIDFDIDDLDLVAQNFNRIKNKIKYSSPILYQAICNESFNTLNDKLKIKVLKYLKRGKYRAVPFAGWSGIGVGNWAPNTHIDCNKSYNIQAASKNPRWESFLKLGPERVSSFQVNQTISYEGDAWIFHTFTQSDDRTNGAWDWVKVEYHPALEKVINYLKSLKTITIPHILTIHKHVEIEDIGQIIYDLISVGMLIPKYPPQRKKTLPENHNDTEDTYIQGEFFLDKSIKIKLDHASHAIATLLEPNRSRVLDNLTHKLQSTFDDRFVPLDHLLHPHFQLWEIFDNPIQEASTLQKENHLIQKLLELNLEEATEIDITDLGPGIIQPNEIESCDYLFKISESGRIVIDNLLINQKGKLSGRFNHLPNCEWLAYQSTADIALKAEVLICEATNVHRIFTGIQSNIPFIILDALGKRTNTDLEPSELFLGIDKGRLKLVNKEGLQIIPQFHTPISYTRLTHPLAKILWHFSEENLPKCCLYQNIHFLKLPKTPRIIWNDLILMPQKWFFEDICIKNPDQLRQFIQHHRLPKSFLFGESDAELLIDTDKPSDLLILLDELKNKSTFFIYEWINTMMHTAKGYLANPQFHYCHESGRSLNKPKVHFVNKIYNQNQNWTSIHITVNPITVEPTLSKILKTYCREIKKMKWYFLVYDANKTEIRIRFQTKRKPENDQIIKNLIAEIIMVDGIKAIQKVPYNPEYDKYGKKGMTVSESIFHLESQFLCDIPNLNEIKSMDRVLTISLIWSKILIDHSAQNYIAYYKSIYANYDNYSKKSLQRKFQEHRNDEELSFAATQLFVDLIEALDKHHFDGLEGPLFTMLNHIHMFCNRFMLLGEEERTVFYFIYRHLLSRSLNKSALYDGPIGISMPSSNIALS